MLTKEQIKELVLQLAQQQTPSKELLTQLDSKTLRQLLEVVQQLRAQGLAGVHTRTPERLLRMYTLLNQRTGGPAKEPTADEIVQAMPRSARNQILGQEALLARQSNAQAVTQTQKQLAQTQNKGIL